MLHILLILSVLPSVQLKQLIETKLTIERIWKLDVSNSELSLTFELEQGDQQVSSSLTPVILDSTQSSTSHFDGVQLEGKRFRQLGVTLAATSDSQIVGVRKRFEAAIACSSNRYFPFDSYSCSWSMITFEKPKDELDLRWNPAPIDQTDLSFNEFVVTKVTPITCTHSKSLPSAFSSLTTHVIYGCLSVRIDVERPILVSIIRYFAPTSLALGLSWLALWTKRKEFVPRMILVATSIMVQVVLVISYLSTYVTPPHITPADVWAILMGSHTIFLLFMVFLISLTESRAQKQHSLASQDVELRKLSVLRHQNDALRSLSYKKDKEEAKCNSFEEVMRGVFRKKADRTSLYAVRIQLVARIVCPIVYIVTTTLYFVLYLVSS